MSLKPEYVLGVLGLLFGLLFMFLIRPLNIPDEPHHFIRAYQLSTGEIFVAEDATKASCINRSKTYDTGRLMTVPRSVAEFASLNREDFSIRSELSKPLNPSDTTEICTRQTYANSPVGYLPASIAIALARPFNASPILMDYAARLAVLVTWLTFLVCAVKIIPVRKWAVVAITLLPLSVQQSISISSDVLSIAPTVLFVAILVRSFYEDRSRFYREELALLGILATVSTLAKPVLIFLCLLTWVYKYPGRYKANLRRQVTIWRLAATILPFVGYLAWSYLASHNTASITDIFLLAEGKISYMMSEPLSAAILFLQQAYQYVSQGMSFGQFGSFGHFTHTIPATWTSIGIAMLAILLLTGYDDGRVLSKAARRYILPYNIATIVVAVAIAVANIFIQYIIWTHPGSVMVEGVQFRYFLPSLLLLACLLMWQPIRSTEQWYRNFVIIGSITILAVSTLTLLELL